jgi:hypothetical protein
MPYVVKVLSANGTAAWLDCGDSSGIRSISIREKAAIFPSLYEAGKAISRMPPASSAGLLFYIEESQSDGESLAAG